MMVLFFSFLSQDNTSYYIDNLKLPIFYRESFQVTSIINYRGKEIIDMSGKESDYIKKISHIGIAVKSLDEALPLYQEQFGLSLEGITEVASEQVKIAFLKIGDSRFELLEPLSDASPIAKYIEKRGEGIHHIALEVDNIEARLKSIKSQGIRLINETSKKGAHNTNVAFIHPKSTRGVLFEFCEETGGDHS